MSELPKLVLAVVNKAWECDPVLAALLGEAAPPLLRERWPTLLDWPRPRRNPTGSAPQPPSSAPRPRAIYTLERTVIELWCVSDLLEHYPDEARYQSSSQRKAERLPIILGGRTPDVVIGISTATVPIAFRELERLRRRRHERVRA